MTKNNSSGQDPTLNGDVASENSPKTSTAKDPRDQYKLLLSDDISFFGKKFLYRLLKYNFFPMLTCFIFSFYYPPRYGYGIHQSIFLNFFWLLQVYSVAAITVIFINFLWCRAFKFNLTLAYKYAPQDDSKAYVVVLQHIVFILIFFTLYGLAPRFSEWMVVLGIFKYSPDMVNYTFWMVMIAYVLAVFILGYTQYIIQNIFMHPTKTVGKMGVRVAGILWVIVIVTAGGSALFLNSDEEGFVEMENRKEAEYHQWVRDGKPQFLPWHIPMVSLPTPQDEYEHHLLARIEELEEAKVRNERFHQYSAAKENQEGIDKYNQILLDIKGGKKVEPIKEENDSYKKFDTNQQN